MQGLQEETLEGCQQLLLSNEEERGAHQVHKKILRGVLIGRQRASKGNMLALAKKNDLCLKNLSSDADLHVKIFEW